MHRLTLVIFMICLPAGVSAANGQTWRASRAWITGTDSALWIVGADDRGDERFGVLRFWHGEAGEGALVAPRASSRLQPVEGNPRFVAADAVALRILFSDLTMMGYTARGGFSPSARWLDESRVAPLAWCGDATNATILAIVETDSLVAPTTQTEGEDTPTTTAAAVPSSRYTMLEHQGGRWRRIPCAAEMDACSGVWLASRGGRAGVFGFQQGALQYYEYRSGEWAGPVTVVDGIVAQAVWAGIEEDGATAVVGVEGDRGRLRLRLFQSDGDQWNDLGAVRDGTDYLQLQPRRDGAAVVRGQLAVARATRDGAIEFGACDIGPTPAVRFATLSSESDDPQRQLEMREAMALAIGLAIMTLVIWTRREEMARPIQLEEGWAISAVWRRAAATILDFAPAAVLASPLALKTGLLPTEHLDLLTLREELENPERQAELMPLYWMIAGAYGFWCAVWESIIATTPGKYLFGCRVIDLGGGRPSVGQCIVRNFVRTVMVGLWAPGLIITLMTMVILTRNRQRVGDLLARTLVIEPAPPAEEPPPGDRGDGFGDGPLD